MNDKKEFEVLRPIGFKGDRVERGTILALTDEEVANIGAENLKAMDEVETPAEETVETTAPEATETPAADETAPAETSEPTDGEVEAPAATDETETAPAAEGDGGAEQPQE